MIKKQLESDGVVRIAAAALAIGICFIFATFLGFFLFILFRSDAKFTLENFHEHLGDYGVSFVVLTVICLIAFAVSIYYLRSKKFRSKFQLTHVPVYARWTLVLSFDSLMVVVAWFFSYVLHNNFNISSIIEYRTVFTVMPLVWASYFIAFLVFKTYRGIWGYSSVRDLSGLVKAISLGFVLINITLLFFRLDASFARANLFVTAALLLILTGGTRIAYRRLIEKLNTSGIPVPKQVLIVGAGLAGEGIIRDILRNKHYGYDPVGILDDHRNKLGQEVHRVRVLGSTDRLIEFVEKLEIELVIIAMPSASSRTMQRLVSYCVDAKVTYRTLPGLSDITEGNVSISDLREVSLDDLLGRDPVCVDQVKISSTVKGKVVLVSGGGGSIGSELCRQIAKNIPNKLIVVENCEFNLYKIQLELQNKFTDLDVVGRLVDVADRESLDLVFSQYRPQLVFHAAAYKHVPMLEDQIRLAVRNNVLGSRNMADVAASYGVNVFVQVSTDKAVNPTNIMGMTKRVAEIYCQDLNQRVQTKFITVRFGNVLGSVGSVVPLFEEQLKHGGPLTVTHPDMTRFFMTIPEASSLILQGAAMGNGGEIFVLDMGEPVKIDYLAKQLIRLSGKEPEVDVKIKYTGLRPGEKMFEELFHEGESEEGTSHGKINQAQCRQFDESFVAATMHQLISEYSSQDDYGLFFQLTQLVPEYKGRSKYINSGPEDVEVVLQTPITDIFR